MNTRLSLVGCLHPCASKRSVSTHFNRPHLAEGHYVGSDALRLVRPEGGPAPPETRLHLVGDAQPLCVGWGMCEVWCVGVCAHKEMDAPSAKRNGQWTLRTPGLVDNGVDGLQVPRGQHHLLYMGMHGWTDGMDGSREG